MRILLLSVAAVGLTTSSAAMWAAETGKAPDRVLCKNEHATGTRFQRRTCVTSKERERRVAEQRKGASELIDRPLICVGKEGC